MKKILFCLVFCLSSLFANERCIFCQEDLVKTQSVFESDCFTVLLDYAPRVPGHLLVIPKRHVEKADQLMVEEWQEFSILTPKIVELFKQILDTDHYLILQKNGCAFQSVPHVHFHFLPIHSESWDEIFNQQFVQKLDPEMMREGVNRFRSFFK
ncbi:MAG TPA: HIT family protein [Rhabdochlamydiaceae bacterium]|nr:HIT family protein [Rhabdochlamydiaceae bacterium]